MHHGLFTFFVQRSGFRTVWLAGGGYRLVGIAAMSFVFGDFHSTHAGATRPRQAGVYRRATSASSAPPP